MDINCPHQRGLLVFPLLITVSDPFVEVWQEFVLSFSDPFSEAWQESVWSLSGPVVEVWQEFVLSFSDPFFRRVAGVYHVTSSNFERGWFLPSQLALMTRRARSRKFFPRPLTAAHIAVAVVLKEEAERKWKEAQPRINDYLIFCEANSLDPSDVRENLPFIMGQQLSDNLSIRTVSQYARTLNAYMHMEGTYTIKSLQEVCKLRSILSPIRHAEDFDDETLLEILHDLRNVNSWGFVVATLMMFCGLRYRDLSYLTPDCIEITKGHFRADVTRTKTIRADLARTELVIPVALALPSAFDDYVGFAFDWLLSARTPTLAPLGSVDLFNKLLKEVWSGRSGRAPTSYTFRRAAFRRFIAFCRSKRGIVNWSRVARFSLHLNTQTVQAFYNPKIKERLRSQLVKVNVRGE